MKLCSFDIGTKNLAYCVVDQTGDKVSIEAWGIVNLFNDTEDKILCSATIKGKKGGKDKPCGKKATFSGLNLDSPNPVYYCGTHKKLHKPLEAGWEDIHFVKSEGVCSHLFPKKGVTCDKAAKFKKVSDGKTYCTSHKRSLVNRIIKDTKICKVKKKKKDNDPQKLADKIYTAFDKIPELVGVDRVLIENQPSLINPVMKTIACFVMSYFVVAKRAGNPIEDIKFISPSNKTKIEDKDVVKKILAKVVPDSKIYKNVSKLFDVYLKREPTSETVHSVVEYMLTQEEKSKDITKMFESAKNKKDKTVYNITKELSIKYTEVFLETTGQKRWADHLDGYTKKDDLCDAFLQAYYFLKK